MKRLLLFLLLACNASAASYWVDTTNAAASDANPGTLIAPWKTISNAVAIAVAGDFVTIQPGTYSEFLTCGKSGSAGSPITFSGVRAADGSWLTIVDPSTALTNGWVAAPEIGSGVYKQTNSFATREMTIDNKRVAFVWTNGDMSGDIGNAYYQSGWSNGCQLLAAPSNQVVTAVQIGHYSFNFWDGIDALYGTTNDPNYTTYLRFRNGDNPNGKNIRVAPNYDATWLASPVKPTIGITSKSYLTFSNLLFRGSFAPIYAQGATCHHLVIASNYFSGGWVGAMLFNLAHDNLIANNSFTANYYGDYGTNIGAWTGGTNSAAQMRQNIYCISKFLMGHSSSFDQSIYLNAAGNSNTVSGNSIVSGLGSGIYILNDTTVTTNTIVAGNSVLREPSCGIVSEEGQTSTYMYSNSLADCDTGIRYDHMDRTGETNRVVYVYRNTSWEPDNVGDHIYVNFYGLVPTYWPEYWTYQNSYSGGRDILNISAFAYAAGGIPGCRFINNIMSGSVYANVNSSQGFWTNATMVGIFDYNLVTPPLPTFPYATNAAWYQANNLTNASAVWTNLAGMSFQLPAGSKAIDAAIDTTQTFNIAGTNYAALPQGGDTKVGSAWDIGALEFTPPAARANSLHVINAFFK